MLGHRVMRFRRTAENAAGRIAVVCGTIALWQILSSTHAVDSSLASSPVAVLRVLLAWGKTPLLYSSIGATIEPAALGLGVGLVLGAVTGIGLAYLPLLAAVLQPGLASINAIPWIALTPLVVIWFGIGQVSPTVLACAMAFFTFFANTYAGLIGVNPEVVSHALALGANRIQLLVRVYLPTVGEWVLASMPTAVGLSLTGALTAEYIGGSSTGLGMLLEQAQQDARTDEMFAALVVILVCAWLIIEIFKQVATFALPWQHTRASESAGMPVADDARVVLS
jgi:ABC-type nitrate/sulfonate/bicarbonate transport system permease component